MNREYLLTIAIPTYNGANTIGNALDLLLPQMTDEVELVIYNNCSNDNTENVIFSYIKRYPDIKYIKNRENLGADGNFLQCMRMATGKFTMLLSDDDILVEGALEKILTFLKKNEDVSLVFLYTIGFLDKYIDIAHCNIFMDHSVQPERDLCIHDKKEFMKYVGRQWGFTSSFLWNTNRMKHIENPEQYYNTYWLQSYIHIMCSNRKDDYLGIVSSPCVAAGGYGIIGNYDSAKVEGIYYKKMIDFAVENGGYDKKQLEELWLWKVCYLSSRAIVKERSIGKHITTEKTLFDVLKKYPYAWLHLFPFFFVPPAICRLALNVSRKRQGRDRGTRVNRPT